jgi:predicted transcriptional regulator
MTDKEIAERCGVTQQYIGQIRNGYHIEPRWSIGDELLKMKKKEDRKHG